MNWHVVFSPEAEEQFVELYHYIAQAESASVAAGYVDGIVDTAKGCKLFRYAEPVATIYAPAYVLRITKTCRNCFYCR